MKIIHILNELKFSGAEIMYVDAAPIFQQLGAELTVVSTAKAVGEYASYFENAGYEVLHKQYPKGFFVKCRYWRDFIKLLKQERYDVVHIHRSDLKLTMSFCAAMAGCKSVYTFHTVFRSHWYSYPLHVMQRWFAKNLFGCKFQTISDSVYNNEKEYYHNNTTLVYNWYGSNRFYPAKVGEKELIRTQLGLDANSLIIISVGGCSEIKRHSDIIKAIPEVIKKYPNLVYLHLGEGDALADEKQLVDDMNVSQYVRFCGNQTNVRNFLIASDIYLMPSKHEGISITTIETLGCYIPAILYDVPGLRDFNREAECSILIQEDYKLLASAICDLYQDRAKQEEISKNGKELVDTRFNMNINAKRIFNLYNKNK